MNWESERDMDRDVEQNPGLYAALADGGGEDSEESESFVETARRIRDEERDVLDALDE